MSGCEMIHCPKFKDGKCTEEQEYVDSETGGACCSKGRRAILKPAPDLPALLAAVRRYMDAYGPGHSSTDSAPYDALRAEIEKAEAAHE